MASPAHADRSPRIERVRQLAFGVLVVVVALLGVSGVWLAFRYEPSGGAMRVVHDGLALVAVVAALVAAAATVGDAGRSTPSVLPAVVVFGLIAALYLTGPTLGWSQLMVRGEPEERRGMVAAFDEDVGAVIRDGDALAVSDYRRVAWLHSVALPAAVTVIGASGVWARRRRDRPVPRHAADPVR